VFDNTPTWSHSTYSNFCKCKRLYFYDKYWSFLPNKWDVYKLKYISSIPLLKGSCIHEVLEKAITDYINEGKISTAETAKYRFMCKFRDAYNESKEGHWRTPKRYGKKASQTTNLFEHYYGAEIDSLDKAKKAEEEAINSINSLWTSPIWKRIFSLEKKDFLTVDDPNFPSFNLNADGMSIKVYSIIDLAINYNGLRIIDWKTGKASDLNRAQLAVYALYAKDTWDVDYSGIKFYITYLSDNTQIKEEKITIEQIEDTKQTIITSYKEMLDLYNDGEPNIANFPQTENLLDCSYCKYKEVCQR